MNSSSRNGRAPKPSARAAVAAVCLTALLVLSAGCDSRTSDPPSAVVEKGPLASALEQYADVIKQLPDDPRAQEAVKALAEAAQKEGFASAENAHETLMYRFPDSNLGLYLFDRLFQDAATTNADEALRFCARVREKAPASPLALAALNQELTLSVDRSPDRFLATCDKLLSEDPASPSARVALFRRAEFYRDSNRLKEAGMDFVRFWARFPQKVNAAAPIFLDTELG